MVILRNEARELIRQELDEYDDEKSHKRREETLFEYSVGESEVYISMEAPESGGAYMMPTLVRRITRKLSTRGTDIEYVEDERTGTRADGKTPNKRIDVTLYLNDISDEELTNLCDSLK